MTDEREAEPTEHLFELRGHTAQWYLREVIAGRWTLDQSDPESKFVLEELERLQTVFDEARRGVTRALIMRL